MTDRCDEIQGDLIEYAEGGLPSESRERIETHLAVCPSCAGEARRVTETLAYMRALPEPRVPDGFWDAFGSAVRQRIAVETPPRLPWPRRAANWFGECSWLRPLPALGAAVVLALLLAVGLLRTSPGPRDLSSADVVAIGESLAIAQNLDVLERLDVLEDLDLLEQLPVLREPEFDRRLRES